MRRAGWAVGVRGEQVVQGDERDARVGAGEVGVVVKFTDLLGDVGGLTDREIHDV